ncbi:trans-2-enoyl-CoA reductase family protein [Vibrio sp. SM6]|uniref:Enoyl-[acyl-carrier-protein] reductase [NADH] n=1 Tax=Vibrio agarilyticus TaxID=2726741 RepID=A0A7X8TRL0_9VIBR|nr:enoyl-ACP reductase FabV [Vibrio agarilyticus]NLS13322.1 trans-2-enoyl-CoA reductase family protein [Vibrio agarilyticus]
MRIEPIIDGVIARSAHPLGCQAAIEQQIKFAQQSDPIKNGPKRVLIIGASSGFGLAARIALTFGGANADTIGVSFERAPSQSETGDIHTGSAGWFNNLYFEQAAKHAGRTAITINGDAFANETREHVVEAIETYFEGEVDLVIYSVAAGIRPKYDGSGAVWRSCIKPVSDNVTGSSLDLEHDRWMEVQLPAATPQELDETIKVMGGEDWQHWIDTLVNAESVSSGFKTLAFSYIGPELTHPIYLDGTLGCAKVDLHQTSHSLNLELANFDGNAYAAVCKAVVTKASVFIPGLTPYLLALYRAMKEKGTHEECIGQMQRLFRDKLYGANGAQVDGERLIRMDDWEMSPEIQRQVNDWLEQMDASNFTQLGDYQGVKQAFMQLNGFAWPEVNYTAEIDMTAFIPK